MSTGNNNSVMNMTVGQVMKALTTAFQQASKSVQSVAQSEPDPTAKAALSSVASTLNSPSTLSTTTAPSRVVAAPPTTITISQGGSSASTTLPSPSPSVPIQSSTSFPPPPPPVPSSHRKHDIPKLLLMTVGAAILIVMLLLAFTDSLAFVAFFLLLSVIVFVLYYFGFVSVTSKANELDITYNIDPLGAHQTQTASAPAPTPQSASEVFFVSDNLFTYEQAPLVCKAYGSHIASYMQVEQAYNQGAEWCGYGWSEGGIALYPTQQSTWEKMQAEPDPMKRAKCGRPGINGGYFDPKMKFGVNCYGIRPAKPVGSATVPSTDPLTERMLAYITKNLTSYVVQPFNGSTWSENPIVNIQSSQTQTASASPVPGSTPPTTSQTTTATRPTSASTTLTSAPPTVPEAPAPPPTVTAPSTSGTNPMGAFVDTFNRIGSDITNIIG